jgi:hypothetical protein
MGRLSSRIPLDEIAVGARLLWNLPTFLRHPISVEEARLTVRYRLDRREADFLALALRAIYQHAPSPYRQLLHLAGCEYGDLERLVRQEGVEATLRILYRHGVYLTVDELKGRRPLVRGGATVAVDPDRLRNPLSGFHVRARTSGSRGGGTFVAVDLASIRDIAANECLTLDARGGIGWVHAHWSVPGGSAIIQVLRFSGFGARPIHWFSQVDPASPGLHFRYRWSTRALRLGGILAGAPLPAPQYVPLDNPLPIARWMAAVLSAGGTPHLFTFPSSAVRLCRAATDGGVDIRGAQFTLGSEPTTEARAAVVRQAGGEPMARYATVECGLIGSACPAPDAPDDVHLFHDLHGLIQAGPDGETTGLPSCALLISSLRATAPLILLNVSLGDQAVVAQRACGCSLEQLGWTTHLHTIRSFEKLTAGGMTFLDTDVIRVLEEVLPAQFGGAPTDYQLLEEEGDEGQPRVRLIVHPAVGPLDSQAVAAVFLNAIGAGSGAERVMGLLWRNAGLLQVERRPPVVGASGKIQHLHVGQPDPSAAAARIVH